MAATAAFAGSSMVARWAARRVAAHAAVVTALPATQKGSSWSLCHQHTHHHQQQQQQQQRLYGTFAARRMSTVAGTDDVNQQQQQQAPPQGFDASEGSEDEEEVYDSSLEAEDDDDLPSNLVLHEMLDIEQDDTCKCACIPNPCPAPMHALYGCSPPRLCSLTPLAFLLCQWAMHLTRSRSCQSSGSRHQARQVAPYC